MEIVVRELVGDGDRRGDMCGKLGTVRSGRELGKDMVGWGPPHMIVRPGKSISVKRMYVVTTLNVFKNAKCKK